MEAGDGVTRTFGPKQGVSLARLRLFEYCVCSDSPPHDVRLALPFLLAVCERGAAVWGPSQLPHVGPSSYALNSKLRVEGWWFNP
jgi:hypothetical protein